MPLIKTNQVGIRNSIRNLCEPHFNLINKKETQTCVNWLIRYIIQDVGLKYLYLPTAYETKVQSLFEACERDMAKESKGMKYKSCPRSATITPNLTSFHSKIHSKTPLFDSTPRLHSMTPPHKLHSAIYGLVYVDWPCLFTGH